ncbi:hypothetical protein Ocin01_03180 [Orchesella cincta]|uniref:Uncharacterized protein n=1 Tax=Orchesella cincta TaxID=48709 RepID=A0A1D2NE25_ORCCI|nr:hypothetical protein Ocin01_03180 [Orchesella cincta]
MDSRSFFNNYPDDELLKFNELQLLSQPSFLWTLLALGSCVFVIMLAFTPLFFGFLLLIFLLLTLAKVLGINFTTSNTNTTNFMSRFSRDAIVCYVYRKTTNERFFRGADKLSDLPMLQTAIGQSGLTTTMDLERILMIFPPDRSTRNTQGLSFRSEDTFNSSRGELNRSAQRMSYFDLSMRRYQESSYEFYKEEKPIVFKFIPNSAK